MRWQALIVLLAVLVGIAVPPALPLVLGHDGRAAIGTLDLCHSSTPALSSNGEMPCVSECTCSFSPLVKTVTADITKFFFTPSVIAFPDERPPKA